MSDGNYLQTRLIATYTRAADLVTHTTIFGYGEQGLAKLWYTIPTQLSSRR